MRKLLNTKRIRTPQEKLFCNYVHRMCTQTRLDGYDFCIRHILRDKCAPFRQCSYTHSQNRKRCTNAAPKIDKRDSLMKVRKVCNGSLKIISSASPEKSLCPWHSKRALLGSKAILQKKKPVENIVSVLTVLEPYCQAGNHNPCYDPCKKDIYEALQADCVRKSDLRSLGSIQENNHTFILDQTWCGNSDESEPENVDSELDDPLKHASIYTAEEITRITRDKLIRLQALYIDQFKRLQHVLREKRRNYLHEIKVEKKTLGSIHSSVKITLEQTIQYEKLKALNRYHRRSGEEAVLQQQAMARRHALTEGVNYQPQRYPICIFSENGKKCNQKAIVMSKFCLTHILSDPHQVLFKSCTGGRGECTRPVIPYVENNTCLLHVTLDGIGNDKSFKEKNDKTSSCTLSDADIMSQEPEHFQSMDDIASLGLDAVVPGSLFGLNQFGEPGESTDSALSGDQTDLMQIQPITLNSSDILCDSRKSIGSDVDK